MGEEDCAKQENPHHRVSSIVNSCSGCRRYNPHEHYNLHPDGESHCHHYLDNHAGPIDHKHARHGNRYDFNPDSFHRILQNLDIQRDKPDRSLEQGTVQRPARESQRGNSERNVPSIAQPGRSDFGIRSVRTLRFQEWVNHNLFILPLRQWLYSC